MLVFYYELTYIPVYSRGINPILGQELLKKLENMIAVIYEER